MIINGNLSAMQARSCSHCSTPPALAGAKEPTESFTASAAPQAETKGAAPVAAPTAAALQGTGQAAVLASLEAFHLSPASLPAIAELAKQHPPEKVTHVLYHDKCQDGFGAAYGAWKARGDEVEYIGVTYQRPAPELPKDARVAIVDFSFPREQLEDLKSKVADVVVLDHHKSAKEGLQGLDYAVFDMKRAGAGLSWHYFNPDKPLPELLAHVEKRDLWDFESLDRTKEVHSGLSSYPQEFGTWDKLAGDIDGLKTEGAAIQRATRQQLDRILAGQQVGTICGHQVPVVNSPVLQSELGNELLIQNPDAPFAGAYYDMPNGQRKWSLRGREGGFDVSSICKQFGGGGHAAAGGFEEPTVRQITVEPPPAK
jgi:hypothetical protein